MTICVSLKNGRNEEVFDVATAAEVDRTVKQGTYRDEFYTGSVGFLNTSGSGDPESPDSIKHVAPRQYTFAETWILFSSDDTPAVVVAEYRLADIRGWRKSVA